MLFNVLHILINGILLFTYIMFTIFVPLNIINYIGYLAIGILVSKLFFTRKSLANIFNKILKEKYHVHR